MKPYLLFAGSQYYPSGGWEDFVGSFDSTEEAKDHLLSGDELYGKRAPISFDWYQIVFEGRIVDG